MGFVTKLINNPSFKGLLVLWLVAVLVFLAIAGPYWDMQSILETPEKISGYSLFGCILFLGFFRVRKHLSVFSLIKARWWFAAHTIGGLLALALYIFHVESLWPQGTGYVQLLAGLMILVTVSGCLGYLIEKIFPKRLTQQEDEILYSQVPEAIYQIKTEAENLMLEVNKSIGSETLSRHYIETLQWFFQKPRFKLSHIFGSRSAEHWLSQQFSTVERNLDENEKKYSEKLEQLARKKLAVDNSYAVQTVMKTWLLFHVPLSAALILMCLWHLLLVNIYVV
jgi:hypothetical protein